MSECFVTAVPAKLVPFLWDKAIGFLAPAIEKSNGEATAENIYKSCCADDSLLVLISKDEAVIGAAILSIYTYETGKKVLSICQLGGTDMKDWLDKACEFAMKTAISTGCEEIYAIGREGWERALADQGYSKLHTIVSIKVEKKI